MELQRKLNEKDNLIATLSNKDKLTQETTDKMLDSIKSLIMYVFYCTLSSRNGYLNYREQNNAEIEKARTENVKLKAILAKLSEKYFNLQVSANKT